MIKVVYNINLRKINIADWTLEMIMIAKLKKLIKIYNAWYKRIISSEIKL